MRCGMTRILALWLSAICFSMYDLLVTQFTAWKNSTSDSPCTSHVTMHRVEGNFFSVDVIE